MGAISTSILVERNVVVWGDLQAFDTADDREADRQRHVIRETKSWCGWALMMSGLRLNTSSKPSPNKHFFLVHFHCHYFVSLLGKQLTGLITEHFSSCQKVLGKHIHCLEYV